MKKDGKKWIFHDRAIIVGLATVSVPLLVFTGGFVNAEPTIVHTGLTIAFILSTGVIAAFFFALHLRFWFSGLLIGLTVGVLFAYDLLRQPLFEQQFFVSMATMMFFVALGFMFGAIAELIHKLHHVFHGGKLKDCPVEPELQGVARK